MIRAKRVLGLIMSLVIVASSLVFFYVDSLAAGWIGYVQPITLGMSHTDMISDSDVNIDGWISDIYSFSFDKPGILDIHIESAYDRYFNGNKFAVYSRDDVNQAIAEKTFYGTFKSATGVYVKDDALALPKGDYYFMLSIWDSYKNEPYSITLSYREPVVNVSSINLSSYGVTIKRGYSATISATVNPTNASDKTVIWSSADPAIATVNNGTITGVSIGNTAVKASSADGEVVASCNVSVVSPIINVTSIYLDKNSITLEGGDSKTLIAAVYPEVATNRSVTWISTNTSVATVSGGKVVGKNAGTATIIARSSDGLVQATCSVKVFKKVTEKQLKSVKSSKPVISKLRGVKGKFTLKIKKKISYVDGYEIYYKSSGKWKSIKTTTLTTAVTNLKKGKYKVKVRAYIKKMNTTYYGKWSSEKKVTVK